MIKNGPKALIAATTTYLLLPNLLFFFYWFFKPLNLVLVFGLILLLVMYLLHLKKTYLPIFEISRKEFFFIVIAGLTWTLLTGVGGTVYQMPDFRGHNAKLLDLFNNPWPLIYEYNNLEVIYYFGYYLTPAFLMKQLGFYSHFTNYIWVSIGFILASFWLYVIFDKSWKRSLLFIMLGSGAVLVNVFIFRPIANYPQDIWPIFITSIFEQSCWTPNQVLPTVLISGIYIYLLKEGLELKLFLFPMVLICLWCLFPVVALSIVIIASTLIFRDFSELWAIIKEFLLKYVWIIIPLFFYYQSSNGGGVNNFMFDSSFTIERLLMYLLQLIPELAIIAYLRYSVLKNRNERIFVGFILFVLLLLPLVRLGVHNDFVARSFLVFYIFAFFFIVKSIQIKKKFRIAIAVIFLDVAVSSILMSQKIIYNKFNNSEEHPIYAWDKYKSIYELFKYTGTSDEMKQYSSKNESVYIKYLAKKKRTK